MIGSWTCQHCGMSGWGEFQVLAHTREHLDIELSVAEATGQPISGFPILITYHPAVRNQE